MPLKINNSEKSAFKCNKFSGHLQDVDDDNDGGDEVAAEWNYVLGPEISFCG